MTENGCELAKFFVFDASFDTREGQELEKILYFYPTDVSAEKRKMSVGLCEAIVKFMTTFSVDDCEALHTQKTKQVFYRPENNFWMVMTVNVPYIRKMASDGTEYFEYRGEQVQTKVLESVLVSAHRMFRFFMGPFASMSTEVLKNKFEIFFQPYIQQLNIPHCDILDIFQGVQYLPLDRLSFLKVQCLVNLIEANFPEIKQSVFLYNDQLIWNGISPTDVKILYKYLVDTLLPEHIEKELQGGPRISAQHYGCFVSPPGGFKNENDLNKVTRVHLYDEAESKIMYLVVYRALAATICFFIEGNTKLSLELMHKIDTFVSPQLSSLASEIGEQYTKDTSPMNNVAEQSYPKYLYFNQLNYAYKSTVHLDNRHDGNISINSEVLKIIADINSDKRSLEKYGEITIKTLDDYWVIGKVSNLREFYVIIQHKNANLKEIHEEAKKILESKLRSIFFYPI